MYPSPNDRRVDKRWKMGKGWLCWMYLVTESDRENGSSERNRGVSREQKLIAPQAIRTEESEDVRLSSRVVCR